MIKNPLFRETSFPEVVENCGLKCVTTPAPFLDEYGARAVGTLTDTELDAISAELNDLTASWICREGFDHFHLGWIKWFWTPDGYIPDLDGKDAKWPLAPSLTISQITDLAKLLHLSLPTLDS